jgi:hypothetical protein
MRILNVIVTSDDDGLNSINSFASENVEQAEKLFVEQVVHYSDVEDASSEAADVIREDAEQFIDDGCYEFQNNEEGVCVWLTWTDV